MLLSTYLISRKSQYLLIKQMEDPHLKQSSTTLVCGSQSEFKQQHPNQQLQSPNQGSEAEDEVELMFQYNVIDKAKKNINFEIEQLQSIQTSAEIRQSSTFDLYCHDIKAAAPQHGSPCRIVCVPNQGSKDTSQILISIRDFPDNKGTEISDYLKKICHLLLQMKNQYLLTVDRPKDRSLLKKKLFKIACHMERTRLYLDDYIYPRDIGLNLIDIDIQDPLNSPKKSLDQSMMHNLVVKKDFFTAYEVCRAMYRKIRKFEGKDMDTIINNSQNHSRISSNLVYNPQIAVPIRTFVESEKLSCSTSLKEAEVIKKQIRTTMTTKTDTFWKLIQNFSPSLSNRNDLDEVLQKELSLVINLKNANLNNHETQFVLYKDNLQPLSNITTIDPCKFFGEQKSSWVFLNIPLQVLIANNLVLIIKIFEKKFGTHPPPTRDFLQTDQKQSTMKCYRGYSLLPLTNMFWAQQLNNGEEFYIERAKCYRPSNNFNIEEKYVQFLEKRGLRKYEDKYLQHKFELSYSFLLTMRLDMNTLEKDTTTLVSRISMQLSSNIKDKDSLKLPQKKEENRSNDIKIDLKQMLLTDCIIKRSPVVRIEVALRDNQGIVQDTIHLVSNFEEDPLLEKTYESLIYISQSDVIMHEHLFVRIPTKSIDNLKELYLIFIVQGLNSLKDSQGQRIKAYNAFQEIENLQFKNQLFGTISLFDFVQGSIIKNNDYSLILRLIYPERFQTQKKYEQLKAFTPTEARLKIKVTVLSKEFTHNTFINKLMLLQEKQPNFQQQFEPTINQLKTINPEELINFHDKILDKLFQILTYTKSPTTQDLIFETVIQIIQLFQNEYKDYKQLLDSYISNHFSHSKVYISLLHQVRHTAEIIKRGFKADKAFQNEECLLATLKHLGIILKLVRISFLEEQPRQVQPTIQSKQQEQPQVHTLHENCIAQPHVKQQMQDISAYMSMKYSMIQEEDEEEDQQTNTNGLEVSQEPLKHQEVSNREGEDRDDAFVQITESYDEPSLQSKLVAQKGTNTAGKPQGIVDKIQLNRDQFRNTLQHSLYQIFEGCHKDQMKSTMSLRAILYGDIVEVLNQMVDFMDANYLTKILTFLTQDTSVTQTTNYPWRRNGPFQSFAGNLRRSHALSLGTSSKYSVAMGNRSSELIEDYVTKSNFLDGLKDLNFINEEYITKHKIIAMGQVLSSGILERTNGATDNIVHEFCEDIELNHLKRPEMSTQVFYFLHQLFLYLNNSPSDQNFEATPVLSKKGINLKEFFTRILPEISSYLRMYFKEGNPQQRIKESKPLETILSPFYEKTSLVFLSVANEATKETLKELFFNDKQRLQCLVDNLRKLIKKINFKKPYHTFFEKKKVQVIRKINEHIIELFMDLSVEDLCLTQKQIIPDCRILHLVSWIRLTKLKVDYVKTVRGMSLAKDQMTVQRGQMLASFYRFWSKFKQVGEPWLNINSFDKDIGYLIQQGQQKSLKLFMEVISGIYELEYQRTGQVQYSSSCIFQVYNDLHQLQGQEKISNDFYTFFEKNISQTNLYAQDNAFVRIADNILDQMRKLKEAMNNVFYSKVNMENNLFYRTYCQAKLMEVFWELKLFKLFSQNRESFKSIQKKMQDYSEMAFTDLRFLQIIQQSEASQLQIGQKEITALIQIDLMKGIVENLSKVNLYEKSVITLNQMKDLYENVLFDYEAVSKVLIEQSRVYKQMAENQNRHYASYFKIGFFGQSFPSMLKNQEFIYRGATFAKRFDILQEIKKHFPDVQIVNYSAYPKPELVNGNQKYLQVTSVLPMTFRELKDFGLAATSKDKEELALEEKIMSLPETLRVYYIENFKNKFYQETLIPNTLGDQLQNDIQIEIFKVKDKFPSLFRMQNICKVKKIKLNAVDQAIRKVNGLNERLLQQKQNVVNQIYEQGNLQQLGGYIQGTLDSPIQGGILRIVNVFVCEYYLQSPLFPKVVELVSKVREHCQILNDAIQLFSQNSEDDRLVTKYQGDYKQFKANIDEVVEYVDDIQESQSSLDYVRDSLTS